MNTDEFEKKLKAHSESILSSFDFRLDIETEEFKMADKKKKFTGTLIIAAALLFTLTGTTFAAYKYLTAKEVADELDKPELAEYFTNDNYTAKTVTDGDYRAVLLGIASGRELNGLNLDTELQGGTYAVVAVEKADGTDMTQDDCSNICVSPLIEGFKPWQVNIATMHGGYTEKISDGIMYRIIECDDIGCFADRKLYIGVSDRTFISGSTYNFDEESGKISESPDYDGTNILFELKLEPELADKDKAEKYIKSLRNEGIVTDG